MAGTFLGAIAPSLFFKPRLRRVVSGQDAARPPGRVCAIVGSGRPARIGIDPIAMVDVDPLLTGRMDVLLQDPAPEMLQTDRGPQGADLWVGKAGHRCHGPMPVRLLRQMTDCLRPVITGARALHEGAKAMGDAVVDFVRVLPSALACGAADTMAAHGRDPKAGLALCFDFEASDDDDWEEALRRSRESYSYHLAVNGIYPTEVQHIGLYNLAVQARRASHS